MYQQGQEARNYKTLAIRISSFPYRWLMADTVQQCGYRLLTFRQILPIIRFMDIQSLSMNTAQNSVQEEVGLRVEAMALNTAKEQGDALARIMDSAEVITDPAKGNYLNMFM